MYADQKCLWYEILEAGYGQEGGRVREGGQLGFVMQTIDIR
jgi:hypothetical protein